MVVAALFLAAGCGEDPTVGRDDESCPVVNLPDIDWVEKLALQDRGILVAGRNFDGCEWTGGSNPYPDCGWIQSSVRVQAADENGELRWSWRGPRLSELSAASTPGVGVLDAVVDATLDRITDEGGQAAVSARPLELQTGRVRVASTLETVVLAWAPLNRPGGRSDFRHEALGFAATGGPAMWRRDLPAGGVRGLSPTAGGGFVLTGLPRGPGQIGALRLSASGEIEWQWENAGVGGLDQLEGLWPGQPGLTCPAAPRFRRTAGIERRWRRFSTTVPFGTSSG